MREEGAEATWPQSLLKDFRICRQIGTGAYSTVWEAVHRATGRAVAIKREDEVLEDLKDGKCMLREIRLLQSLRHPNVVRLFDVRAPKTAELNTLFLVLELAQTDLRTVLKSGSVNFTPATVQRIMYDILRGLKYVHSAGVLHRDLKPGNILLSSDCIPRICDFGLARSIGPIPGPVVYLKKSKSFRLKGLYIPAPQQEASFPRAEELKTKAPAIQKQLTGYVQTRWYRAPEVMLVGSEYGPGIDMWALGCVFGELLSLIKGNSKSGAERAVLFPGESCYPYSPARGGDKIEGGVSMLETDQLHVILNTLGTPSADDCAFVADREKLRVLAHLAPKPRTDFAERFPAASKDALDLLSRMLVFNPYLRITCDQCLEHPYFTDIRQKERETASPVLPELPFETEGTLTAARLKELFQEDFRIVTIRC